MAESPEYANAGGIHVASGRNEYRYYSHNLRFTVFVYYTRNASNCDYYHEKKESDGMCIRGIIACWVIP